MQEKVTLYTNARGKLRLVIDDVDYSLGAVVQRLRAYDDYADTVGILVSEGRFDRSLPLPVYTEVQHMIQFIRTFHEKATAQAT